MTVKQLKAYLSKYPDEMEVVKFGHDHSYRSIGLCKERAEWRERRGGIKGQSYRVMTEPQELDSTEAFDVLVIE